MSLLIRHLGVFCIILACASIAAYFLPAGVDAKLVLYGGVVLFALYLGVSYIFGSRTTTSGKSNDE